MPLTSTFKMTIETQEVTLEAPIHQSLDQLLYLDNFSRLQTRIEVHQPAFPFYSDQKRISVILNNLLSNAFRYADPSKEQPWLRIQVRVEEKAATLVVSDNGIGIAAEHQG